MDLSQPNPALASWCGPRADFTAMASFGIRLRGGGAHQSKTMMLSELGSLLATGAAEADELYEAAIEQNALGKNTATSRNLTYRHLASLYGLKDQPPLTKTFFRLWKIEGNDHPLQALLVALARDPLLRDSAQVVVDGVTGSPITWPLFQETLAKANENRFREKMLKSLAQNCASTWTQTGHLVGAVKKIRRVVSPTPETAALAGLLAATSGFSGPSILGSAWFQVLDLSPEQALDKLRQAESRGLARVRAAGDVIEISVRQQLAATLGVPELEHV